MIGIKGEYNIQLTIYNMFNSYSMSMDEHNIVTDGGVELLLNCAIQENNGEWFGGIHVGYGYVEPYATDTIDSFEVDDNQQHSLPISHITVEDNTLTYDVVCDGQLLDGTNEIGIWSNTGETLVTRSVHDTYSMPTGSEIRLKYKITIINIEEE